MSMYTLLILSFASLASASIVTWIPQSSFNVPINFNNNKIPCSKETVVFPENIQGSIRIEDGTSVNGFILPNDGVLELIEGTINIGEDSEDSNCSYSGNVYYIDKTVSKWIQPDVWSSPRFNEATPDAERIPCFDDIVEFPVGYGFSVQLPDTPQRIRALKINGKNFNTEEFRELVLNPPEISQQFILNEHSEVSVKIEKKSCQSRSGCACQKYDLTTDCAVKFCPVPKCVNPIRPEGHCCMICGGFISFQIDGTFDIMKFTDSVEKEVTAYGKDKLVYHIGIIHPGKVQLVIVEKGEYEGLSSQVVYSIDANAGLKLAQVSGSPLSKYGLGGKIAMSTFFVTILMLSGLYLYYYKFTELRLPGLVRRSRNLDLMSRFQSRTDSVVSLTRRDSDAGIGTSSATSFRNPLYDSKRGRVRVTETEE